MLAYFGPCKALGRALAMEGPFKHNHKLVCSSLYHFLVQLNPHSQQFSELVHHLQNVCCSHWMFCLEYPTLELSLSTEHLGMFLPNLENI